MILRSIQKRLLYHADHFRTLPDVVQAEIHGILVDIESALGVIDVPPEAIPTNNSKKKPVKKKKK
jgi:hypothetical protein